MVEEDMDEELASLVYKGTKEPKITSQRDTQNSTGLFDTSMKDIYTSLGRFTGFERFITFRNRTLLYWHARDPAAWSPANRTRILS